MKQHADGYTVEFDSGPGFDDDFRWHDRVHVGKVVKDGMVVGRTKSCDRLANASRCATLLIRRLQEPVSDPDVRQAAKLLGLDARQLQEFAASQRGLIEDGA